MGDRVNVKAASRALLISHVLEGVIYRRKHAGGCHSVALRVRWQAPLFGAAVHKWATADDFGDYIVCKQTP